MKSESLFRIPGYARLWGSILLSNLGAQLTMIVLPLTAVVVLHASPTQMGLLGAMELLPFVVLSLPAGVYLDRIRKLPVYISGELLMAAMLVSVPIAWTLDMLSMGWLYVVGIGAGVVYTVAGSASQIVLTQLVGRDQLVKAHAQNAIASSTAEVIGPGIAGLLIKLLGGPLTLLVDCFLVLCSALMLKGLRIQEKLTPPEHTHFWGQLQAGLAFVRSQPVLIHSALVVGAWQFFAQMAMSIQVIYAVRELGMSEEHLSVSYVALGAGSIAVGMVGPRLSKTIGPGPALLLGIGLTGLGWLQLALFKDQIPAVVGFALMLMGFAAGATLLFINFLAIRQSVTPSPMLGRMTTTMRWLILLPAGPGALLGGWLGEHTTMVTPILLAGVGALLTAGVGLAVTRLRHLQVLPQAPDA
ncbi:MFS transporter [Limnohabitans radicicola]|uniref:MFS transporter n=1 Tax=Limnohabitans radicicola TaxID=2771427 RepID=A0A927FKF4_9BURK|nr:MFS transporter [Limnohabitans radicicola]MBD8051160.1 MFS transporter [Limnohabitans radicicola]